MFWQQYITDRKIDKWCRNCSGNKHNTDPAVSYWLWLNAVRKTLNCLPSEIGKQRIIDIETIMLTEHYYAYRQKKEIEKQKKDQHSKQQINEHGRRR